MSRDASGRRWYDPFTGAPGTDADDDAGDPVHVVPGARGRGPQRIGAVAQELAGRRDWTPRLEGARIHACWPAIAGPVVAAHVEPVRLMGGVLVLRADSGSWATQVRYLAGELVARANAELGDDMVRQVTVTTG